MEKLKETSLKFPQTEIWNDSCSEKELCYALEHGAVGATTNPVIVLGVLKQELPAWEPYIQQLIAAYPHESEDDIAWRLIQEMGVRAGRHLDSLFIESQGKKGRISYQVNAKYYKDAKKIVDQALVLNQAIQNAQIKAPTSKAGIEAFETLTYLGVSINATVSFTVAQAVAVAEAVERGLNRREAEGKDISKMNPVCTIMAGRVDDYLKKVVEQQDIILDPECLEYAGVAVTKKAYQIYQERNYRTTLLVAAYRNHYHWSSFIGGKIILTIPYKWQVRYNQSNVSVVSRIDEPIPAPWLAALKTLPEFIQAYEETAQSPEDFEHYGAFKATMNQFLGGYDELVRIIRSYMV